MKWTRYAHEKIEADCCNVNTIQISQISFIHLFYIQQLRHVVVDERSYINVDTTTDEGIEHAYRLGFQNVRHVAEVVITPLILPTTAYLFSDGNKAMMFTLMRHPVDRTISMFYYLQGATWGKNYSS